MNQDTSAPKYQVEKQWSTSSGLLAVVIMGSRNHRCGYVAVPPSHLAYGKGYHEQLPEISQEAVASQSVGAKSPVLIFTACVGGDTENAIRRSLDILIDVHGGITFASSPEYQDTYPIPSKDLWWFGFDCAHYMDDDEGGRSLEYCIQECERMATQLVALSPLSTNATVPLDNPVGEA